MSDFKLGAMYRTRRGVVVGPLEIAEPVCVTFTRVPQLPHIYGSESSFMWWRVQTGHGAKEHENDLVEMVVT